MGQEKSNRSSNDGEETRKRIKDAEEKGHKQKEQGKRFIKYYSTPCKFRTEDQCKFGTKCWFRHEEDKERGMSQRNESNHEEGNRNRAAGKRHTQCRFEHLETGCKFGPKHCTFMHTKNTDTKREEKRNIEDDPIGKTQKKIEKKPEK